MVSSYEHLYSKLSINHPSRQYLKNLNSQNLDCLLYIFERLKEGHYTHGRRHGGYKTTQTTVGQRSCLNPPIFILAVVCTPFLLLLL